MSQHLEPGTIVPDAKLPDENGALHEYTDTHHGYAAVPDFDPARAAWEALLDPATT